MNRTILAALALAATVSLAQSATVVLSARGHVTAALGTVYSPAGLGSEVEVLVTYDETSTDLDVSPTIARYQPSNFSLALRLIGGLTLFQTSVGSITVDSVSGTFPALHILARLPDGNDLFFLFRDDDRSFVSSDALPTSFGSIADWDRIDLSVLLNPAMWPYSPSNPIDVSFSAISIPEPSITALAALCSILGLSRRNRAQPKGRIGSRGVFSSPVPHHPAYGFDSVPPSMREGFAEFLSRYSAKGIVQGGAN